MIQNDSVACDMLKCKELWTSQTRFSIVSVRTIPGLTVCKVSIV